MDATTGRQDMALPPAFRAVGWVSLQLALLLAWSFGGYLLADGVPPGLADKDFANYWVSAHLAAAGQIDLIFGPNAPYLAHLRSVMGPDFPWHNWSYPPHYLLLILPLALVGYKAGLALVLAVTGGFFAWSVRAFVGRGNGAIALTAVAPLALVNVWAGQNGFLTSGLMLGTLALRARRPALAGLCLGLLSVKPQLAVLLPLLLLIERRWTVLATAAATTGALVAASWAAFGGEAWTGYLGTIVPYQAKVMMHLGGGFLTMMPSLFGGARLLGLDAAQALQLHALFAVAVAPAIAAAFLLVADPSRRSEILLAATFLVTPYALSYDLGCLGAALASFVARERGGAALSVRQRLLIAAAMLLPVLMMMFGLLAVPIAPLVLTGVFLLMLRQAGLAALLADRLARRSLSA